MPDLERQRLVDDPEKLHQMRLKNTKLAVVPIASILIVAGIGVITLNHALNLSEDGDAQNKASNVVLLDIFGGLFIFAGMCMPWTNKVLGVDVYTPGECFRGILESRSRKSRADRVLADRDAVDAAQGL